MIYISNIMKSFLKFLNEIATNNQDGVSNQAISSWINGLGGPALNYDFSNLPPTGIRKRKPKPKFYKLESNDVLKFSDIANVKVNFPDANFWITRKGSVEEVGKPNKHFDEEKIGIKVTSNKIDPNYLFYMIQHLHSTGFFKDKAIGILNLKSIRISMVKNIQLKLND